MRRDPRLGLFGAAVVDGDVVARVGEMARHRPAHHAQPDECDFCHVRGGHNAALPGRRQTVRAARIRARRSKQSLPPPPRMTLRLARRRPRGACADRAEYRAHADADSAARCRELTGATVYLKFENLQFTAAYKERGALNTLLQLTARSSARGVIAASAGNHAQGLAYHATRLGIPVTIVMPRADADGEGQQTEGHGAEVDPARRDVRRRLCACARLEASAA